MKFHEFSFQKKLFISCILLNSLLLVGFSLFFYYYSANSLRENMRSTLSGSASMIQNNLDTLLNDADNTLKELRLNASLLDTARISLRAKTTTCLPISQPDLLFRTGSALP